MGNFIPILVTTVGLSAYIPTFLNIYNNKTRSSFCTWILWSFLNIIVFINLASEKAPYLISIIYTIGTLLIALMLIIKKQYMWSNTDTLITILVAICGASFILGNPYLGIIVGSIASFVAGIPEIINVYKNPRNGQVLTSILFMSSNILVIISTQKINFINIIYPTVWFLYWMIIFILSKRVVDTRKAC